MSGAVDQRFKWLALAVPGAAAVASIAFLAGGAGHGAREIAIAGGTVALSTGVAWMLYSRLRAELAPVGKLMEAASAVSAKGDTVPGALAQILAREPAAMTGAGDFQGAIDALLHAYNELELQLQFRDVQLRGEREALESRVAERTAELTKLMEELRAEKARAEAGGRSKAMFLANMSHEIRTPMNGIIGMADLVLESTLTAQQHECIATMRSSAESLTTIINDVLDFSKIEAGKLELNPAKFNLRESLFAALGPLALGAENKGLELACRVLREVPDALVGDAGRLRQIVVNLVGNSIKFTERGEVVIHVETESTMLGGVVLHLAVSDTGIGIGAEEQVHIFKPFEQADGSATREYGGTGLGLAIVFQLVQLMGGRIWFDSERGKGSVFHFTLRFGLQRMVEEEKPAFALADSRVLVVDDNETARSLLVEQARDWKLEPIAAESADAAITRLAEADEPVPLAWIDARMPGVDGFALTEQLRNSSRRAPAIVLLLPQASRLEKSTRERSAGIAAFVSKPVYYRELFAATRVALGLDASPRTEETAVASGLAARPERVLRILLAEDNPVNQAVALRILRPRGHDVTVAENGEEAVAASETADFDVVLMDLSMPKMSGLEATLAIREREKRTGKRLRILALTAHALKGDKDRCLDAGMDGYVTKPIRMRELCAIVEGKGETPTRDAPRVETPQVSVTVPAAAAPIERDLLLEKFDGNLDAFREIANVYLENCPRFLANIRSAMETPDLSALVDAAHTLKGTLSIFSVESAFQAALRLEKLARAGELEQCRAALPPLVGEVERLNEAVGPLLGGS